MIEDGRGRPSDEDMALLEAQRMGLMMHVPSGRLGVPRDLPRDVRASYRLRHTNMQFGADGPFETVRKADLRAPTHAEAVRFFA